MPAYRNITRLFLIITIASFLFAQKVQAQSFFEQFQQSLTTAGQETGHATTETKIGKTLPEIIARIINAVLQILGIIFMGLIIYGGYIWFSARGNDSEVKKAQDVLRNSVIGLIIVLAAYAITNFVGAALLSKK
jgi:hypothetical protein